MKFFSNNPGILRLCFGNITHHVLSFFSQFEIFGCSWIKSQNHGIVVWLVSCTVIWLAGTCTDMITWCSVPQTEADAPLRQTFKWNQNRFFLGKSDHKCQNAGIPMAPNAPHGCIRTVTNQHIRFHPLLAFGFLKVPIVALMVTKKNVAKGNMKTTLQ